MSTLLEKLDNSSRFISVKQSVCNQIQRILSSRTYLGTQPGDSTCVTGFGLPDIVDTYAGNEEQQRTYCQFIRRQILLLEPRVKNVEVKGMSSDESRGSCQLLITLGNSTITENFYF